MAFKALRPHLGSPPRMRGKVIAEIADAVADGITPAYAGKSASGDRNGRQIRDHPRVCGEKVYEVLTRDSTSGSPPRMRGKVDVVAGLEDGGGITPAYAGKSNGAP